MTGPRRIHARLEPAKILAAYRAGYFPMADPHTQTISWYSPDPRAVIPLDQFHVSRSLRQTLRKGRFEIRVDTSFVEVIHACARRDETWISGQILHAYAELHRLGYAHSVESWMEHELVGGLYGVVIGGVFFGESMFSRTSDASKAALVFLVHRLQERGFGLLDTQFINDHVRQFGAIEIRRSEYLALLKNALEMNVVF